ncbi:MAG TPA: alpha/beta fold hydrolase, partial [Asanoa sp.]|nr:alpha/beta fold hydrolase [Asanoa sp.]
DLRGFGDSDPAPVDATRGVRDYSDDVVATCAALGIESAHFVGWSLGGGVVMQLLRDHPALVRTLTLVNPVSPYGFGGTRGADGEPVTADGAGAGAGGVNPEFVQRLRDGDRSADSPFSPRQIMLAFYVKPPFEPADADTYVESMLSTVIDDDHYPGDLATTQVWPGVRAGTRGVLNTMAPNHFRIADALVAVTTKPHITWVRGDRDAIVSDTSLFDLSYLGSLGFVPGWPGAEASPPQPMIGQTRAVFDRYAAAGGGYREVVYAGCGHSPHIERPAEFVAELLDLVGAA